MDYPNLFVLIFLIFNSKISNSSIQFQNRGIFHDIPLKNEIRQEPSLLVPTFPILIKSIYIKFGLDHLIPTYLLYLLLKSFNVLQMFKISNSSIMFDDECRRRRDTVARAILLPHPRADSEFNCGRHKAESAIN